MRAIIFMTMLFVLSFSKAETVQAVEKKLWVYEKKSETSNVVGILQKEGLLFILGNGDMSWCYVESGEIHGFVKTEDFTAAEPEEDQMDITEYALQFVGNPYVWGGTSLTEGADCSGFVQSVYAAYGYELPRVAEDQAKCGTRVPVAEAEPGDLIFYEKNGYIYHVVMYLGDGRTVEAANSAAGIISSKVNYERAVWAVRLIPERK